MFLRYGKYQGVDLRLIPLGYLTWVLNTWNHKTLEEEERDAVRHEVERRDTPIFSKVEVQRALDKLNPPQWDAILELHLIDAWYLKMACEFSPGKVGNHLQLTAIKRGHDLLKEMVKDAS